MTSTDRLPRPWRIAAAFSYIVGVFLIMYAVTQSLWLSVLFSLAAVSVAGHVIGWVTSRNRQSPTFAQDTEPASTAPAAAKSATIAPSGSAPESPATPAAEPGDPEADRNEHKERFLPTLVYSVISCIAIGAAISSLSGKVAVVPRWRKPPLVIPLLDRDKKSSLPGMSHPTFGRPIGTGDTPLKRAQAAAALSEQMGKR